MKKTMMAVLSLAVCAAVGLSACSPSEEENVFTGETVEEPEYQVRLDAVSPEVYTNIDDLDLEPGTYISIIGKTENSSYWQQVEKGVMQAADDINERLGYSGEDKVKVLFNAPANGEDIDEQVNILDEEMARYPDVIAIASIDENASAVQFDLAISNGIPIVAFDTTNSYQEIQCTCMTDNKAAGADGAAKLCEAIGESGEVALLVHDSVSGNAKERASAFEQEITENHTGVSVAETIYLDKLEELKKQAAAEELGVSQEDLQSWMAAASGIDTPDGNSAADTEDGEETITEEAKARLEEIETLAASMSDADVIAGYLAKHPDLKGVFATNADSVMLGVDALESMENGDTVTLMGFDAGKEQIEALGSGAVDGLIVQNPFGMGYATVVAAARTVLEIGNEAVVDTGYVWVTGDNMDEESIAGMLYE